MHRSPGYFCVVQDQVCQAGYRGDGRKLGRYISTERVTTEVEKAELGDLACDRQHLVGDLTKEEV